MNNITIKEAALKSLEELKKPATSTEVYNHIVNSKFYEFSKDAKTPASTVSALMGDLIRLGDTRVKRVKGDGGVYSYYLAKYEDEIGIDKLNQTASVAAKITNQPKYDERDLHILLSSYLNSLGIFSKTIFHEKSLNSKDANQKWVHPDLVGISLTSLKTSAAKALMKSINQLESIRIYSYELKKEINTDYDLKHAFFQTVSNSRWANFGYLVTLEISDNLIDELERLSESFGIGVILLSSYPYESRVLFQSQFKELDFKTIDKLCLLNKEFKRFIELSENILSAEEKYQMATQKELFSFCDTCFTDDKEIVEYCEKKNIPFEERTEFDEFYR